MDELKPSSNNEALREAKGLIQKLIDAAEADRSEGYRWTNAVEEAESFLSSLESQEDSVECEWENHREGAWLGSCGYVWEIDNSDPKNCPLCGKPIRLKEAE